MCDLYKRHLLKNVWRGIYFQQDSTLVYTARIFTGWLYQWLEDIHEEVISIVVI